MINSLILALAMVSCDDQVVMTRCVGGSCATGSCATGSCATGSCATGSCSGGSCGTGICTIGSNYYSGANYTTSSLHLSIKNIPNGKENNRIYAKAKVNDRFYNIPVINGILPDITRVNEGYLILDYADGTPFNHSFYGESDHITYADKSISTKSNVPGAVKNFDNVKSTKKTIESKIPSGVKHPDSVIIDKSKAVKPPVKEVDSLLNSKSSDLDIESFLKKPSSVQ